MVVVVVDRACHGLWNGAGCCCWCVRGQVPGRGPNQLKMHLCCCSWWWWCWQYNPWYVPCCLLVPRPNNLQPPSALRPSAPQVAKTLSERISQFCVVTLDSCAYAGSGNVLKVQQLLAQCGEHITTDDNTGHKVGAG